MNSIQIERRRLLKAGGAALAAIPIIVFAGRAAAATNAQMRSELKYQDHPNGAKRCADCVNFNPGKTATSEGGCRLMPGDTEISPQGYCTAWADKGA